MHFLIFFPFSIKRAAPGGAVHVAAIRVMFKKLNAKQASLLLKCDNQLL